MKNKILLIATLLSSSVAFAQHITYGGSAGAGIYSMRGEATGSLQQLLDATDGILTTKPVTGYYAGGYANIPVGENLSIEPGLYYSKKGYQLSGNYSVKSIGFLNAAASAVLNTSYVDLPLLFKANFKGLQVFAGPQVSYLTGASLNSKVSVAGINLFSNKLSANNQLNKWDAAAIAGIGYQFENGLRINAAYERGLSKMDAGKNTSAYNQGFKIGLGFSF